MEHCVPTADDFENVSSSRTSTSASSAPSASIDLMAVGRTACKIFVFAKVRNDTLR